MKMQGRFLLLGAVAILGCSEGMDTSDPDAKPAPLTVDSRERQEQDDPVEGTSETLENSDDAGLSYADSEHQSKLIDAHPVDHTLSLPEDGAWAVFELEYEDEARRKATDTITLRMVGTTIHNDSRFRWVEIEGSRGSNVQVKKFLVQDSDFAFEPAGARPPAPIRGWEGLIRRRELGNEVIGVLEFKDGLATALTHDPDNVGVLVLHGILFEPAKDGKTVKWWENVTDVAPLNDAVAIELEKYVNIENEQVQIKNATKTRAAWQRRFSVGPFLPNDVAHGITLEVEWEATMWSHDSSPFGIIALDVVMKDALAQDWRTPVWG